MAAALLTLLGTMAQTRVKCLACGQLVGHAKYARHCSRCCPELLDPEGWHAGDAASVEQLVVQMHGEGSAAHRLAALRFGFDRGLEPRRYDDVAEALGISHGAAVKAVMQLLDQLPTVAEAGPVPLRILHEDTDLLVVDKPAGTHSTPRRRWRGGSVLNWAAHHGVMRPSACHRLDSNTTGVLVIAKHSDAAREVTRQFAVGSVKKQYIAVSTYVDERPPDRFLVDIAIKAKEDGDQFWRRRLLDAEDGGVEASSAVRTLVARNNAAVLLVEPRQGRTHQVRLHLSHAELPIYGDGKYGGAQGDRTRHALHAASLAIDHPRTGERLFFTAPLPDDMRALMAHLFPGEGAGAAPPDPALEAWWTEPEEPSAPVRSGKLFDDR